MTKKIFSITASLFTVYMMVWMPLSAVAQDTQKNPIIKESPLYKEARRLGLLGGNAKYCKADREIIEQFIGKAQGQLNSLAKDKYEKVFVNVEFKNLLASYSIKAPKDPCDQILDKVKIYLRSNR